MAPTTGFDKAQAPNLTAFHEEVVMQPGTQKVTAFYTRRGSAELGPQLHPNL